MNRISTLEFRGFGKVEHLDGACMVVTQKIHGTNAQVVILEVLNQSGFQPDGSSYAEVDDRTYFIRAGSRTRWLSPEDDNYGFAAFVDKHKEEFIRKLGVGQHFGEWAGPGINSGEGLEQRTFVLFDPSRYPEGQPLPPQTVVVPVLYDGKFDLKVIDTVMNELKANGSKLKPGFMRPEGVVVNVLGQRLKKVFEAEETMWKGPSKVKAPRVEGLDVSYLLQPIRLEKLVSRDERYLTEFPRSLAKLCSDYVADLIAEDQILGDEDQVKAIRKALGSELFRFIKYEVTHRYGYPM